MDNLLEVVKENVEHILEEWKAMDIIKPDQILVIGCSTSEVIGQQIGTAGSEEVAAILFESFKRFSNVMNIHLAFQCCEHLNRALVVERGAQKIFQAEEVSVIPTPSAGGSMAAYAYRHFEEAIVVEEISADIGIDIGDTLIGMHLKRVAVPLRFSQTTIGSARINAAKTRPKLIGGARAKYE